MLLGRCSGSPFFIWFLSVALSSGLLALPPLRLTRSGFFVLSALYSGPRWCYCSPPASAFLLRSLASPHSENLYAGLLFRVCNLFLYGGAQAPQCRADFIPLSRSRAVLKVSKCFHTSNNLIFFFICAV